MRVCCHVQQHTWARFEPPFPHAAQGARGAQGRPALGCQRRPGHARGCAGVRGTCCWLAPLGQGPPPTIAAVRGVRAMQVFDVGLLGEGVLHILSAAGARGLLAAGAECVPCKAKVRVGGARTAAWPLPRAAIACWKGQRAAALCSQVFCQLIELNPCGGAPACGGAAPLDLRAWEAFQWAPEYTGKDLAHTGPQGPDGFYACPAGRWRPLTQPAEAMSFDFKQGGSAGRGPRWGACVALVRWCSGHATAQRPCHAASFAAPAPAHAVALCGRHMQPEQRQVRLQCTATGRANAVAFWFELQLVEEAGPGGSIRLSTGPFEKADGGRTWQVRRPLAEASWHA